MIQIFAYCRCNLGDDLFVLTMLRRYPNNRFFLRAAPTYTVQLKKEPNLRVTGKASFMMSRVLGKLNKPLLRRLHGRQTARFDATVRIGGSVFIEQNNAAQSYYPEKHQSCFIIGANFGPYRTQRFLETRRERIAATADCCFRDQYSYRLFAELPQVRFAPDVLFGCPLLPPYADGDCIGVSVIDCRCHPQLKAHAAAYERGIKEICDSCTAQKKRVKLLCFCKDEGDAEVAERLAQSCRNSELISTVVYDGRVDEFLSELNSCETIYATRFHAMILGWAMQKSVVPIIYSEKQTHVLEDIGFDGAVWNISRQKNVGASVLSPVNGRLDQALLKELKEKSSEQFSALDSFLQGDSVNSHP